MMYPMERLFGRYVGVCLAREFAPEWRIGGMASEYLRSHGGAGWFNLIPDLLLRLADELRGLETKWKVLDAAAGDARDK